MLLAAAASDVAAADVSAAVVAAAVGATAAVVAALKTLTAHLLVVRTRICHVFRFYRTTFLHSLPVMFRFKVYNCPQFVFPFSRKDLARCNRLVVIRS